MKSVYTPTLPTVPKNSTSLHGMINLLSVSNMPSAIRHRSILINEIPSEILVNADEQKLAAVLGMLLHTVIDHTNDSCIRISAKAYGNVMLVHIKENIHPYGQTFNCKIKEAQKLAEKIGGNVTVTSYRNDVTTVVLSFMNLAAAA
ncbi:MAG TPA: hypothetical protein VF487_02795 [Chitinophagaceae bacterium]